MNNREGSNVLDRDMTFLDGDTFDIDAFVAGCREAARSPETVDWIEQALQHIARNPWPVMAAFPSDGSDEATIHASDELTIVLVWAKAGVQQPPHDHRMTGIVAVLEGQETSTHFRQEGSGLRPMSSVTIHEGETVRMGPSVVHALSNGGSTSSVGFHVYLGDLYAISRSIWHPDTWAWHPFSADTYVALSRPIGVAKWGV